MLAGRGVHGLACVSSMQSPARRSPDENVTMRRRLARSAARAGRLLQVLGHLRGGD